MVLKLKFSGYSLFQRLNRIHARSESVIFSSASFYEEGINNFAFIKHVGNLL